MTALSFHFHYNTAKQLHQHCNYGTKGLKCFSLAAAAAKPQLKRA